MTMAMYTLMWLSVIYSVWNTSLKVATKGDRNVQKIYNDYDVINSNIFKRICWF